MKKDVHYSFPAIVTARGHGTDKGLLILSGNLSTMLT